ncbi:MAG TPA: hypothetical protein VFK89_07170 [Actinomycetota bacterium]|nr:hypothetical protein [Actinomycetota bacterium]
MSSRPDGDAPEPEAKVPGWRQPWDTWRKVMFAGAILLLALALARAFAPDRVPYWLGIAIQAVGYVLLAVGFFLAMKLRREIREKRAAEGGASPRDRG